MHKLKLLKKEENHFIDILIINVNNKYMVHSINLTEYTFFGETSIYDLFSPNK